MIASLIYNTPELCEPLKTMCPEIVLIDCGSKKPIGNGSIRYNDNLLWAQNWHRILMSTHHDYIWMVNSDVTSGISWHYFHWATKFMKGTDTFMLTPAFNSPHVIFHRNVLTEKKDIIQEVNWIDMCAPIIDVKKYRELGGFDAIFKGYFADLDLCYRARLEGFKMILDHATDFNHIGGYTVNKTGETDQANVLDAELICKKHNVNFWGELT